MGVEGAEPEEKPANEDSSAEDTSANEESSEDKEDGMPDEGEDETPTDEEEGDGEPEFELATVDAPDKVGGNEVFTFRITIANTGDSDGTFKHTA